MLNYTSSAQHPVLLAVIACSTQPCFGNTTVLGALQILAKRPHSEDAVFAWHQDVAYWPPFTQDASTVTCWLAVTDATVDNGCMRFVRGSHLEPSVRPHLPGGPFLESGAAARCSILDVACTVIAIRMHFCLNACFESTVSRW